MTQPSMLGARSHGGVRLVAAADEQQPTPRQQLRVLPDASRAFPRRPDDDVLSAAIPLFFIGRNERGFWVAREAEGRCGGLFLFRRAAFAFAIKSSHRAGYATMYVEEPLELDIENGGGRFTALLAAGAEVAARRLPTLMTFACLAAAEWRKLLTQVARALGKGASAAQNRHDGLSRVRPTPPTKREDDVRLP